MATPKKENPYIVKTLDELQNRDELIYAIYLDIAAGLTQNKVRYKVKNNLYSFRTDFLTHEQIDILFAESVQLMRNEQSLEKIDAAAIVVHRFNEIYEKAMAAKEFASAITAERELGKLVGVYDNTLPDNLDIHISFGSATLNEPSEEYVED